MVIPPPHDDLIGRQIAGYSIVAKLGEGGMGAVYRAENALGRSIAVKVLLGKQAQDPATVRRFFAEAKAASRVSHPNVIDISDFGALPPDGRLFLVMPFLRGTDIAGLVAQQGPLGLEPALAIIAAACAGLEAAHLLGIIHRDVKPSNLYLVGGIAAAFTLGSLKVLDFGIAKDTAREVDLKPLTGSRVLMGSPGFMSPEQAVGGSRDVTAAADIYGIAASLYHMLTARDPWELDLVEAHRNVRCFRPDVPEAWAQAIWNALEFDPIRRTQSVREFVQQLVVGLGARGEEIARLVAPDILTAPPAAATVVAGSSADRTSMALPMAVAATQPPGTTMRGIGSRRWIAPALVAVALGAGAGVYGLVRASAVTPSASDRLSTDPAPATAGEPPAATPDIKSAGGPVDAGAAAATPAIEPVDAGAPAVMPATTPVDATVPEPPVDAGTAKRRRGKRKDDAPPKGFRDFNFGETDNR